MRWAGLDAVTIVGKAEKPMYVLIQEGRVEFRDASHLWGRDAIETEIEFKERTWT